MGLVYSPPFPNHPCKNLEPEWPLFLKVNPPKQGLNSNQDQVGKYANPVDPMNGRMTAIRPQDGRSFAVERFHEAPQHYLKAGPGGRRDSLEPFTSMRYYVCTNIHTVYIIYSLSFLDLFQLMFYGLYHDKSPLNHHLEECVLLVPSILSKSKKGVVEIGGPKFCSRI